MAYQHCRKWLALRQFPPKLVEMPDGSVVDATPRPGCTYTRETWPPRGRGRGESLYSPRRVEAKLRGMHALELRQQGSSWDMIARQLGYRDRSGAWRAVRRLVERADWERQRRDELKRSTG